MGRRKRKKHHQGHYCWSCQRHRANERFNGRGHARHLCRDCQKLPASELTYRQHVRNIERCLTEEGFVRRKARKVVEQFLGHDDLRLRAWAEELLERRYFDDEESEYFEEVDEIEPSSFFCEGDLGDEDAGPNELKLDIERPMP
ncbi:MAG TPA: hypothetical protein VFI31_03290 [Pirellulales bacterium]|nr:hypothetical protein [Pirellulales bacterium]